MVDADAVRVLSGSDVGDRVSLELGGKVDPDFGGGPVGIEVELLGLSDGWFVGDGPMLGGLRRSFGPSAVVRVDDIEVLIVTVAQQILDLQQLKSFGIDPEGKSVIALKSMQHFRAAFEPIAGQVIVCDSGALCTLDYERLPYQNVQRPIFPLDEDPFE
jgi:microcystin degradation protein MlrC